MQPGRPPDDDTPDAPDGDGLPVCIPVRVLVVSARPSLRRRFGEMLVDRVESLRFARGGDEARGLLGQSPCDLVIVDCCPQGDDGLGVLESLSERAAGLSGVLILDSPTADDAVRAMRAGACDLISPRTRTREVLRRVEAAARKAEKNRRRDQRINRLGRLCNSLEQVRREVSGQVGGLCNDLVEAYRDMSDQLTDARMTGELAGLFGQELEIEGLLRTALEYTLARMGPTNSAVFLPSSSGDFSLGAYVNHDVPKEHAEVMLDHLADSLAPAFQDRQGVHAVASPAEARAWLGSDAHWLEDRTTLVFACRREDECLAVVALFRDHARPFSEQDVRTLGVIGTLFAAQLERVIRLHHRHLPRDQWGILDPPAHDDTDDGFDEYGRAA